MGWEECRLMGVVVVIDRGGIGCFSLHLGMQDWCRPCSLSIGKGVEILYAE